VKKIGFIGEGATEIELLRSNGFKVFLNSLGLESVGEFDAMGRENLISRSDRIEDFIKIFNDRNVEKIIILSDLETDPCISYYKSRIYNYSPKAVNIIAVKAIESWLLSDSSTLSHLLKERFYYNKPEQTVNLPIDELQEIFLAKTGRGLGICNRKPKVMRRFIRTGFSVEKASQHPNCSSVKYFIKKLEEIAKE